MQAILVDSFIFHLCRLLRTFAFHLLNMSNLFLLLLLLFPSPNIYIYMIVKSFTVNFFLNKFSVLSFRKSHKYFDLHKTLWFYNHCKKIYNLNDLFLRNNSSNRLLVCFLGIGGMIFPGKILTRVYLKVKKSLYLLYTFQSKTLVSTLNLT